MTNMKKSTINLMEEFIHEATPELILNDCINFGIELDNITSATPKKVKEYIEMKKYIGTKLVQATPAIRKGGKVYLPTDAIPRTMEQVEEGYKVVYEDGYESWLPKDVFEKAYKISETPVDRMQIEASELNDRYVKLAAFIDSGKMNEVVNDTYNKCLLEMQCYTMFNYIRLLDARIQRMQGSDGAKVIKMNFGMAIMALKYGYAVRRNGWNDKGIWVIKQVPAHIDSDIIPKMQSLPQSAKDLIVKGKGFIDYTSQCLIYNENTGRADSWVPSISDVFADDWEIVD